MFSGNGNSLPLHYHDEHIAEKNYRKSVFLVCLEHLYNLVVTVNPVTIQRLFNHY